MKIGVIGAGISGLSIARILSSEHEVEILEKSSYPGGIARTRDIGGNAYHITGGHCFNSKYQDVLDFVFQQVLDKNQWHKVSRNAGIRFKGHEIDYPIEYSIQQINEFDSELAYNITKDFFNAVDDGQYHNLEVWFRKKFGNTLAEEYLLPYNRKIWNKEPTDMDPSWVEGKLPMPDKKSFFNGLISQSKDNMPHAEFYYPNSNNQNTFIDALARGLNIKFDFEVVSISKGISTWQVNGTQTYDLLINTTPLNIFPKIIQDCPAEVLKAANSLKYNKVTTMLWETKHTDRTWTYIPESDSIFHRYIHIGNFFQPVKNLTISEAVGERTYDDMVKSGDKDDFLLKPLSFNVSNHAYVVFDEGFAKNKEVIFNYLKNEGLYTLGRFGEWQYYNMDICIKQSIELAKVIAEHKIS